MNAQVNGAKNILKRSSLGIKPKISKKKVLQILIKEYLERHKGCNSAPLELLKTNPYYKDFVFSNSEPQI
jgi:putative transposase